MATTKPARFYGTGDKVETLILGFGEYLEKATPADLLRVLADELHQYEPDIATIKVLAEAL